MRRLDITLSDQAILDLMEIYEFVFERTASASIADGFINRIEARCMRIADTPNAGRNRDDLVPGLQTVAFEKTALIAYVVANDQVTITNVFYKGRDVDAVFGTDTE